MPWKELSKMDERMRFVARLMEGEKMAVLCREFDISRKTGYKLFSRYKHSGIEGLTDRSRRPYRHANRLPFQIEQLILRLKEKHSSWGRRRSGTRSSCCTVRSTFPPSALCTRSYTAPAW